MTIVPPAGLIPANWVHIQGGTADHTGVAWLRGRCCCGRLQEALEAANKGTDELMEQLQAAKQSAVDEATKVAEAHALELQKLQVERTKLEVRKMRRVSAVTAGPYLQDCSVPHLITSVWCSFDCQAAGRLASWLTLCCIARCAN